MHRIKFLNISNFRSIKFASFEFSNYTPLVGYNNAGKTNVLSALSWAVKKTSLDEHDFFDPSQPVSITAEICGIDANILSRIEERDKSKIEKFIFNESLKIRRTQTSPGTPVSQINIEVCNDSGEWSPQPSGIDAAISRLFPEAIFIGAMENATDDVAKFGSGTTIGKLMREILPAFEEKYKQSIIDSLGHISTQISAAGTNKDENLLDIDKRLQKEMSGLFPGITPRTHIPTPTFSDFIKGATIKFFDENFNAEGRDAHTFGHGAQRSVQIALVKCLADIKRQSAGDDGRTTLLLIDEPELYLHPQAIEIVRAALLRLSKEGYQVAFSTHSAGMIDRADAQDVLLIRRTNLNGTYALPRLREAVQNTISDSDHQSELLFELSNSNKFLFSEKVIIAEGKTERKILPKLYEKIIGSNLAEEKMGLITFDGAENISPALRILEAIGVKPMAIADLDFAFHGAIARGLINKDCDAIKYCKKILIRLESEGKILLHDGLPTRNKGQSAAEAFRILSQEKDAAAPIDEIHSILKEKCIWIWKAGDIEAHLGLSGKKSGVHARFLKNIENELFVKQLPDYSGVRSLFDWLRA